MKKQKKPKSFKMTAAVLSVIAVCIIAYIAFSKSPFFNLSKNYMVLKEKKDILELDSLNSTYIGVNGKQIIKITKDGIAAYDEGGEEVWSDTMSLDHFVVRQREPYIAVADKMGKSIVLFNEKGRQGEIVCKNPIIYFSVNKNGNVAVIEGQEKSHIVSAYDSQGHSLVKRVTQVSEVGYPSVAEVSPDNSLLLTSYISVDKPTVTSTLTALKTQKPKEETKDDSIYGIEQKDNLVYEIEFIKDNEWVSIGDKTMTWFKLDGSEIGRKSDMMPQFNPYLNKMSSYGEGFFPVISANNAGSNIIHRQDELYYFDAKAKMFFNTQLKSPATYCYVDDKGMIIGQNRLFTGYNKTGIKLFEFQTAHDVSKVFYLGSTKKVIAVTKGKVVMLGTKREEK